MTTQEFLSDNRQEIINFFNSDITNDWTISLKDFMIDLMNNFRKVTLSEGLKRMDLISNLKETKSRLGMFDKTTIGVVYTKSYKENIFLSEASKSQLPSSMR